MNFFICGFFFLFSTLFAEPKFYSQASQDEFVYSLLYKYLNKKDKGYYLEIGASAPIEINNSYFFEKYYKWKGVSIDISDQFAQHWSLLRENPLIITDATKVDYSTLLTSFPKVIDYLSLDVDGLYDTVLRMLPLNDYTFKIITIEHDAYHYGDQFRAKEREILTSYGYYLLCSDVSYYDTPFEDWWIHPSAFTAETFHKLILLDLKGKDHKLILDSLK